MHTLEPRPLRRNPNRSRRQPSKKQRAAAYRRWAAAALDRKYARIAIELGDHAATTLRRIKAYDEKIAKLRQRRARLVNKAGICASCLKPDCYCARRRQDGWS